MNRKEQNMSEMRKQEKYVGYCQECGCFKKGVLKTEKITTIIRDVEVKAEIYELYCEDCGELLTCKELQRYNDIIIFDAYKAAVNLLTSREIKQIRERRDWSQTQMAEFLGLGEKDITRYENGSIQTRSVDKMMRLLANDVSFAVVSGIWADNIPFKDYDIWESMVAVPTFEWRKAYANQRIYSEKHKKESENLKHEQRNEKLQLAAN